MVGNADYVAMYKSTVGMDYRYQFNLDQVPSLPPLPGYQQTRDPIWIVNQAGGPYQVLLQTRPDISLTISTWYDHWCEVFYVPILLNATSVAIPAWIYNVSNHTM